MLSRLITLLFCLNLCFSIKQNDFILSINNIDDNYLYLSINKSNYICEIDEKRVLFDLGLIKVNKDHIKDKSSIIVFYNDINSNIYKYKISYLGDYKNVHINKAVYYLGYYLEGLNNISFSVNNYIKKVSFSNIIIDDIRFKDTLEFNFSFLPIMILSNELTIKADIHLFIDNYYLESYQYYFNYYKIPLDINIENAEIHLNNDLFVFPKNYKLNNISMLLNIYVDDVTFYYYYDIEFNNLFYNSNYVSFIENTEGVNFEKNILHN